MSADWDYAQLTKTATKFGGPENYLQLVKDASFSDGMQKGAGIGGLVGAGIAGLIVGAVELKKRHDEKKAAAAEAEKVLIAKMNEMKASDGEPETETSNAPAAEIAYPREQR